MNKYVEQVLNEETSVYDKFLNEMAYKRAVIIQKCYDLYNQIHIHITKIGVFDNPTDLRGHVRSIDTWLFTIQRMTLDGRKRLEPKIYYRCLFLDPVDDESFYKDIANRDLKYYTNRKNIDFNKLYILSKKLFKQISEDISNNSFNGIEYYDEYNLILENMKGASYE